MIWAWLSFYSRQDIIIIELQKSCWSFYKTLAVQRVDERTGTHIHSDRIWPSVKLPLIYIAISPCPIYGTKSNALTLCLCYWPHNTHSGRSSIDVGSLQNPLKCISNYTQLFFFKSIYIILTNANYTLICVDVREFWYA